MRLVAVSNILLFAMFAVFNSASAQRVDTIWVDPGQSIDVYWEINVSGQVTVNIDANESPACLDFWWIAWPFGQVIDLGKKCGRATFDLPGLSHFSVGAKLRAGKADGRTRLQVSAVEK